jgi:hypothetical protein
MKIFVLAILILPLFSLGQNEYKNTADSLKFVTDMPYICREKGEVITSMNPGCGDILFWNAVKMKKDGIAYLIEKLMDSTTTDAIVPNFGYFYSVADIAYVALQEIVHGIPTFKLLGVKFDEEGCGYCSYWSHLNENYKNRINFKNAVTKWINQNESNFVWVANNQFQTCDCNWNHPNKGHFELKN